LTLYNIDRLPLIPKVDMPYIQLYSFTNYINLLTDLDYEVGDFLQIQGDEATLRIYAPQELFDSPRLYDLLADNGGQLISN
jgi:hypothetical protein